MEEAAKNSRFTILVYQSTYSLTLVRGVSEQIPHVKIFFISHICVSVENDTSNAVIMYLLAIY